MTDILDELQWRGLVAQSTDEAALRSALSEGTVTYYAGFDPTAPSLHVGQPGADPHVRRLQHAGHRPLPLVGGATGLIGDPRRPGRAQRSTRPRSSRAGWSASGRQIEPHLSFERSLRPRSMVNNLDWTAPMGRSSSCATSASTSGWAPCCPRTSLRGG